MSGLGGLFELVLALLVVGFGFMELRGLRRDKQKAEAEARAAESDDAPRRKAE